MAKCLYDPIDELFRVLNILDYNFMDTVKNMQYELALDAVYLRLKELSIMLKNDIESKNNQYRLVLSKISMGNDVSRTHLLIVDLINLIREININIDIDNVDLFLCNQIDEVLLKICDLNTEQDFGPLTYDNKEEDIETIDAKISLLKAQKKNMQKVKEYFFYFDDDTDDDI